MNIVITMAGAGSRFKKAGYTIPKYTIAAHGKTLFEWSMSSLCDFNTTSCRYYFIVKSEDCANDFINFQCLKLNIVNYEVVNINYLTDGQATTAMLASARWVKSEPLLIYNIDTYVEPNEMKVSQVKGDGFIPCFNAPGEHWSFVKVDDNGLATEVREKVRISDNCTLGAYFFSSSQLYENLYNGYYKSSQFERGEKYVAPLYNYLIQKGGKVYISNVNSTKVHVLGTPEELEMYRCSPLSDM